MKDQQPLDTSSADLFSKDWVASLIGFLVAIPMSLGIAIASGAPAAYGIIGAIVGGLGVGWLTTAPLMVTGPAAGLVAITFDTINHLGIEKLGVVVLLAGIIQILTGVFGIGQLFRAITPAVIHGMMAGIGLIIILSQAHLFFDIKPAGSAWLNLVHLPHTLKLALTTSAHWHAGLIASLAVLVLLWFKVLPKTFQKLPASFYAILTGSLIAHCFSLFADIQYIHLPPKLMDSVHWASWTDWTLIFKPEVLMAAVAMAFIASSKALLTASATEAMHDSDRTQNNKELMVQGVGNMACGMLGCIPLSGEILRSTVNLQSGAKSRYSLVMIGAWLLLFVGLFPQFLSYIPISCLAGLLMFTGFQLLGLEQLKKLVTFGKMEGVIFMVTALAVTFIDPLEGVIIGMVLGLIRLGFKLSTLQIKVAASQDDSQQIALIGKGTFINVPALATALEKLPAGQKVTVDISQLSYADNTFGEFLHSWHKGYGVTGGQISLPWQQLESLLHSNPQQVA